MFIRAAPVPVSVTSMCPTPAERLPTVTIDQITEQLRMNKMWSSCLFRAQHQSFFPNEAGMVHTATDSLGYGP